MRHDRLDHRRRRNGVRPVLVRPVGRLPAAARKDTTDWIRGRRAWVILVVSALFMLLTAANGWITNRIAATLPDGTVRPENLGSMDPVHNFVAAFSAQIFVLATIFVAGSLLARERESGTLAWVASKPVTRASIWLSKWVTTTVMTVLVAGILPLVATVILVTVLYGALPAGLVFGVAVGLVATIAFFAAVGLALGTVIPGQAATIATAFAVSHYCRSSAGSSPSGRTCRRPCRPGRPPPAGESVSLVTPVAWLVVTGRSSPSGFVAWCAWSCSRLPPLLAAGSPRGPAAFDVSGVSGVGGADRGPRAWRLGGVNLIQEPVEDLVEPVGVVKLDPVAGPSTDSWSTPGTSSCSSSTGPSAGVETVSRGPSYSRSSGTGSNLKVPAMICRAAFSGMRSLSPSTVRRVAGVAWARRRFQVLAIVPS